jgi:riboflavin synthase
VFTGIIEHLGSAEEIGDSRLVIKADSKLIAQLVVGASIAVNGVCLTVERFASPTSFAVDLLPETVRATTLGKLKPTEVVNLELPLRASGLLGGHIVQGHVDGKGTIKTITKSGDDHILEFTVAEQLLKYLVDKGSVTINGISLTVIEASKLGFSVGIIPHTWRHTMLHHAQPGDLVNVEIDVLAKYVYTFVKLNQPRQLKQPQQKGTL